MTEDARKSPDRRRTQFMSCRVRCETYLWLEREAVRWTQERGKLFKPHQVARALLDQVAAAALGGPAPSS